MDPNLYPHHRPKTAPKPISSSTSLAFSSTLSSLLSTSTNTSSTSRTTTGRPRPSKTKADIFTSHNKNTKKRAARDLEEDDHTSSTRRGRGQDIGSVDDNALHRSKRKLQEKAKLYNKMKKGELAGKEVDGDRDGTGLVDFDRKWAEKVEKAGEFEAASSSEDDDGANEIVDYEDEYGRARRGTRAEMERLERKRNKRALGAEELDRMSARPVQPSKLIYGDTVQTLAFNPDEPVLEKMEEIAKKRDRSMTPPEQKHYEADKEFRIKGVGFYQFSRDEGLRGEEMEALKREREETERVRREREDKKEKRKREIEERRKEIGEKRAKKQADSFLDGLTEDLAAQDKGPG